MTVEDAPNFSTRDLELPEVTWPTLPPLPASWVIGTTAESNECSVLRLNDALRLLRKPAVDLGSHSVVLHGKDRDLLRLGSLEGFVAPALRAADVPVVVSPAFSTWWEWSPFDSLVAMARSAHFAATLARMVPTIPSVVWRHDHDLSRWAGWISATGATAIAVDLGTLRRRGYWEWGLEGIAVLGNLFESLDAVPHLVVNGPFTVPRMTAVTRRWPGGLTFASQRPWQLAMSGRLIDADLQDYPTDSDRDDLAHANRRTFDAVVRLVVSGAAAAHKDAGSSGAAKTA